QVQRRLAAELHDHSDGSAPLRFMPVDSKNVFESQGLEIEAVAGVVVGGYPLPIAIHHDGLLTILPGSKRGGATAVIEFDALADAIRRAAQNDDLLLGGRRGFVLFFVS